MSNVNAHGASVSSNNLKTLRLERIAIWLIPILLGLRSLALGQDSNWDQSNYHLYNAFALLHGKLHTDLAPAGFQTYFNPLLDVITYLLYQALPAPVVGFIFGWLHGLTFICLLSIAKRVLSKETDSPFAPLLLAVAGCITANFLSGLGNGMGDDTTALFVLTGLAFAVRACADQMNKANANGANPRNGFEPWMWLALSGLCVGLGVGLKLTNAVYGVAIAVAVICLPGGAMARIRACMLTGLGVAVGLAITGGFWFWEMWVTFGNPVFPQFGHIFPNPLAGSTAIVDTSWLPRSWHDVLLWPFVFTIHPTRVGQAIVRELLWPVLYLAGFVWIGAAFWRSLHQRFSTRLDRTSGLVCLFMLMGYIVWLKLFCIIRYVVPMEMLTPLVTYLVITDLLPSRSGIRTATSLIVMASIVVLVGGAKTWGHQKWALKAFQADTPQISTPDTATVLIVEGNPAMGWLATFFPTSLAFTQIGGSFPSTDAYRDAVEHLYLSRGGAIYGMFNAESPFRDSKNITPPTGTEALLSHYGVVIVPNSCTAFNAHIGQGARPYLWCRLATRHQ